MVLRELIARLQEMVDDGRNEESVVIMTESGFVSITGVEPNEGGSGIELAHE